jgi:myo-inositol-1(or 4)-monophosphatase
VSSESTGSAVRAPEAKISAVRSAAIDAAAAAGALIRANFMTSLPVDEVLSHDLKLGLDRMCEDAALAVIRQRFPSHGILSEELGYAPGSDPFLWIVDPLDGTVNFFHGIPFFCTCVSCHEIKKADGAAGGPRLADGRLIGGEMAAVVYAPLTRELFVATPGVGAFMNGTKLVMKPISDLSEAIVSVSLSAREGSAAAVCRFLPAMVDRARKVRSLGSTALEIVHVAAGRTGAFIQRGTNLWDFMAAAAILREAGGVVDAAEIAPGRWKVIAGNPGVFPEVSALAAE